jgi:hypothetical protein
LSVSQEVIGEVLYVEGKLPAALDSFHAIRGHLAKADPRERRVAT